MPKFYITMTPPMPSDDFAQMVVKFDLDESQRFQNNVELASYVQLLLDENISAGKCKVKLLEYALPTDAKVVVRVTGKDIEPVGRGVGAIAA